MNFVRGMLIGGIISAGVMMMYKDNGMDMGRMAKKGRKMVKKMGIM